MRKEALPAASPCAQQWSRSTPSGDQKRILNSGHRAAQQLQRRTAGGATLIATDRSILRLRAPGTAPSRA
eukprot:1302513-Rhodomonas_salina.2